MLSKFLIQFSVDGWSCVLSLLFTWGQTMVEVTKIRRPPSKDPMHILLHSVPLALQQATTNPCLCWRLLDAPRQVWVSLLWGSLLLSPGSWCTQVLFVPSKCLFLQPCVGSSSSIVGLMVASSKRAYPLPRSTAPRAPGPAAVHC